MLIYYIILLGLILSQLLYNCFGNSKILIYVWILLFALMSAIRVDVGSDYYSYIELFNNVPDYSSIFSQTPIVDIGFYFLCSTIKTFGGDWIVLFFVTSFLTSFVLYKASIRIAPQYLIASFIIYYCFVLLRFQFNTIRHGMMVSFIWLAISYIKDRNIRLYLLYSVIGGLFHVVGFLFLPLYWFLNRDISGKVVFITIVLSFILGTYFPVFEIIEKIIPDNNVFSVKLLFYINDFYANKDFVPGTVSLGMFINCGLLFLIYYCNDKFLFLPYIKILKNCLFFGLSFAFIFIKYGIFPERISSVFYVSIIYIVPLVIARITTKKQVKNIMIIVWIIYSIMLLNKNLQSGNDRLQFVPYKTIFVESLKMI